MRELPTWMVGRVAARCSRLLTDALAEAGVRGYHYRLLVALDEFGPLSQITLANRTSIDRSDVVATLNDLAESGSIERSPDPDDGRRNVVTITPAGVKQLRALDAIVDEVQDRLLSSLSSSERRQLLGLLTRIADDETPDRSR